MIRNSALIATVAVALSLLAHLLGVNFLVRVTPEQPPEETATADVSLGNTFEDIAESAPEPVEPEPAAVPEPPVEDVSEAPPVEMETSLALVESANPQPTSTPGTGPAPAAAVDTIIPAEPTPSSAPAPESADQPIAAEVQPTEVTPSVDAAEPSEAARPEPISAAASQLAPVASPELSASVEVAALPLEAVPEQAITPSSDPNAIPVFVEAAEPVAPVPSEATAALVPEPDVIAAARDPLGGTEFAVLASPRPQTRPSRPSAPAANGFGDQPPPILFAESPLTAYARDGNLDGWAATMGSGESGNATATNYAGQVLVRLNRAPGALIASYATARVTFEINPDGSLAWVEISDSTGTLEFDKAAEAQVRNAAPFPPPPAGAQRKFSFIYRL